MINKNVLIDTLTNKFNNLALHSIVNECFINGLPLNKNDISMEEKRNLTKYSYDVMSNLGGFKALESAIVNEAIPLKQRIFLGEIYNICTEASKEVATRIADETDCGSESTKFNDVVDKSSFTKEEYSKFAKSADKMNVDKVADIIQEKTLAVIKDEKEQYEKEEELDNALQEALAENSATGDKTTESYLNLVLDKGEPRHHISLFSKIQESAMELLEITPIGADGEDVLPVVNRVTFESLIDTKEKYEFGAWLESYQAITNEEVCNAPDSDKPKMATLVSIIVYTMLETLKTLNLFNPSSKDVSRVMTSRNECSGSVSAVSVDSACCKAQEMISKANKVDYTKMDSGKLSRNLADFKEASESMQRALASEVSEEGVELLDAMESNIASIEQVLAARNTANYEKANESLSYYDKLNIEHDRAQCDKIERMYGKNPNISEIQLRVNPNGIGSIVDVACANESNQIIKTSFLDMQYAVESNMYIDYLKKTIEESKLGHSDKTVSIVIEDGTAKKILV